MRPQVSSFARLAYLFVREQACALMAPAYFRKPRETHQGGRRRPIGTAVATTSETVEPARSRAGNVAGC